MLAHRITRNHPRRLVATAALAGALALAVTVPALAATSQTTTVNAQVTGGVYSVGVTGAPTFSATTYQFADATQTDSTGVTIVAADATGTLAGWNVTMQAAAFSDGGTNSFSASNLTVHSVSSIAADANAQAIDPAVGNGPEAGDGVGLGLDQARKVLVAGASFGDGSYTAAADFDLTIPGHTPPASYSTTVTTTIAAAPVGRGHIQTIRGLEMSHTARAARVAFVALLAAMLALAAGVGGAAAGSAPIKLGIKPVGASGSYFTVTGQPGATYQLTVELGNYGDQPVAARTYAADAYTIANGGFGARLDSDPRTATTTWLNYPSETLSLAPGQAETRTFPLTIPADAQPGDYITSLIIQNAEPVQGAGNVAINQVMRQAIAVAIDVPGPRHPALAIGAVSHTVAAGHSVLAFAIGNSGNQHLKPAGEFALRDAAGAVIAHAQVALDSVYAGMSTTVEIPLDRLLPAGDYSASLTLADAATGASATASTLSFSVPAIAAPQVIAPATAAPSGPTGAGATIPPSLSTSSPPAWRLFAALGATAVVAVAGTLIVVGRSRRNGAPSTPGIARRAAAEPPIPARPATVRPFIVSEERRR